jgi:hypothetical protein
MTAVLLRRLFSEALVCARRAAKPEWGTRVAGISGDIAGRRL